MPNSINQAGAPTDVQVVPGMVVFGGFGGRSNEGRVNVDGISVGSAFNGAGVSSYIADVGNAREIAKFLSGANPYLPEDAVFGLLAAHGGHHVAQTNQIASGDFQDEATTWHAMRKHVMEIADAIADALGKQFPDRFRDRS